MHHRFVAAAAGTAFLLSSVVLGQHAADAAAPPSPALIGPALNAQVPANPVLSWSAVAGATRYRVLVATDNSFNNRRYDVETRNLFATVPDDLPIGTIYWEVAAINDAGELSPFAQSSFARNFNGAPTTTSPANAAVLDFPGSPPILRWNALAGARTYRVQIDDAADFVGAQTVETPNLNLALVEPQPIGKTYFWRVQGLSETAGVVSNFSPTSTYSLTWDTVPAYQAPVDNLHVTDVVLRWTPVDGAYRYELQVSPNQDFSNNITFDQEVESTQYSPPTTFVNGGYYWRVRAIDNAGTRNLGGWSNGTSLARQFIREWTSRPENVTPTPNQTVAVPTFTWKPIDHASYYKIEFAPDVSFSPSDIRFCVVNQNSWTPYVASPTDQNRDQGTNEGCQDEVRRALAPGFSYYWRVRAYDHPANIFTLASDPTRFTYLPAPPVQISPKNTTVSVPTLTWGSTVGAEQYDVSINGSTGNYAATTRALSWTPTDSVPPGNYTWSVRAVDALGEIRAVKVSTAFTVAAPATPTASAPNPTPSVVTPSRRMPSLAWSPVLNADHYDVYSGVADTGVFDGTPLNGGARVYNPAFTSTDNTLASGAYDWFVVARDASNNEMSRGSLGRFTILDLAVLQPADYLAPRRCTPPVTQCEPVITTPAMSWTAVQDAAGYEVTVAQDASFTNVYRRFVTDHNTLTPRESFLDNQAGQAFYWFVRPCKSIEGDVGGRCSAYEPVLGNASIFAKRSAAVSGLAVANTFSVAGDSTPHVRDELRLSWTDYFSTNSVKDDPVLAPAATQPKGSQAARQYRVLVSTTPDFSRPIDDMTVDQTAYAATVDRRYPEGPLYWKVQAIDGSGNQLTFSDVNAVTLASAPPTPIEPLGTDASLSDPSTFLPSAPAFRWAAQPYALQYQFQLCRNPVDDKDCGSSEVLQTTTRTPAYTTNQVLAPGQYQWRVLRRDPDDKFGPWSTFQKFTITGDLPVPTSPTEGQVLRTNGLLLEWTAPAGAARYRVELATNDAFANPIVQQDTVMLAFAPIQALDDGTYSWRIKSLDAAGNVKRTSVTRHFTKATKRPGDFFALAPSRILDTRSGIGGPASKLGQNSTRELTVTGVGGVPSSGVDSVIVNTTVAGPTASSFLTVFPTGSPKPTASNLNYTEGQAVPNLVVAKVGDGGRISIYNFLGDVDVIMDVSGYYSSATSTQTGSRYVPLQPARDLDTRSGVGGPATKIGTAESRDVKVTGVGGVPSSGVTAVVLNTTATASTAGGFLTVYPFGAVRPTASNLNFLPDQTVANLVVVKVGGAGMVSIFNFVGATDVVADIQGYYTTDPSGLGVFTALTPARDLDTRTGTGAPAAYVNADQTLQVTVNGLNLVPANATGVVLNVTVTGALGDGFVTVYPLGVSRPTASNVNYRAGQTVPNLVFAKVGAEGKVAIYNFGSPAHIIADVQGFYTNAT